MKRTRFPYQVLGVTPDASAGDIQRAFRKLALDWHPDRHPNCPEASQRFQEIVCAYQQLRRQHAGARAAGTPFAAGRLPFWITNPVHFGGRSRWEHGWKNRALLLLQRYGMVFALMFSASTAMAITAIGLREPASASAEQSSRSALDEAMVMSMRRSSETAAGVASIEVGAPTR